MIVVCLVHHVHYRGPPTEPRRLNIIQWCIQFIALVMLFSSTQMIEVSVVILVVTVSTQYFPVAVAKRASAYW